ncbi:hypothetical protein Tco_0024766 [Tanacetum coccineum]
MHSSYSLLLTSMCRDDAYRVTPHVFALAIGICDRLEDSEKEGEPRKKKTAEGTAKEKSLKHLPTRLHSNLMMEGPEDLDLLLDVKLTQEMAPTRRSNPNNGANPDITAIIAQQLQGIIPQIVTQVTNNVNNANENGGNGNGKNKNGGNNNRCIYKEFLACKPRDFDGKGGVIVLTRWIEKMESVMDISGCARGHKAAMGMMWEEFRALLV